MRILLLVEALVVAHRHDLSVMRILEPRDAHFYVNIANSGYHTPVDVHLHVEVAFFPLYPLAGRALSIVTRLPTVWSLELLSWAAAFAIVVLSAALVRERWGDPAARRVAVLAAVFPGGVILGYAYADGLAVALACGFLLALDRRSYLVAGVAGAAAALTLSLMAVPLTATAVVAGVARRSPRPLVAAALVTAGPLAFFGYLWAHTGSPLVWWRVEHEAWNVHLSLPTSLTTNFHKYAFAYPQVAWVTGLSIGVAALVLVAMAVKRAPVHWWAWTLAVVAAATFDGGTHLTPRFVFDAFPGVLVLGVLVPRRLVPLVVLLSVAGLVVLFAGYSPNNIRFLSP